MRSYCTDDPHHTPVFQSRATWLFPMLILFFIFGWRNIMVFFLIFLAISWFSRSRHAVQHRHDAPRFTRSGEKRKNDEDNAYVFYEDEGFFQKPKNEEVRYAIGDDGELIILDDDKPKPPQYYV